MQTLPLTTSTKAAVDRLKPRGLTYDQFVRKLLATRHESAWAEFFADDAEREVALALTRRAVSQRAPTVTRSPSEQVLLARAAAARWATWLETGKVQRTGVRRYRIDVSKPETPTVAIRRVR